MAHEEGSFEELLSEAPLAPKLDTITVVGALSRSREPEKFVLTLANGHSLTLERKAVKSFTRLGGAVGQVLVQLELDAKLGPIEDYHITYAPPPNPNIFRWPLNPLYNSVGPGTHQTQPWTFGTTTGVSPFALATPHQAPPEIVERMMYASPTNWTDSGPPDTPVTGHRDAGTPFWMDGLTGSSDPHIQY
jgi:hypothetical protein